MYETKPEYHGLAEIAERIGKSIKTASKLVHRKKDQLPAKKMGRDWWMTERAFQDWLDRGN